MPEVHKPVLLNEVIASLDPRVGGVFLDATVGDGGHAVELLKRIGPTGTLVGVDRDPEAIEHAAKRLASYGDRVRLRQGNFRDIASILAQAGVSETDGALFDLGVSSRQLDTDRGFSFSRDEKLDMRMDPSEQTPTAADIVNQYSEAELADVIRNYGEERYAGRVARSIVRARPIGTTRELADAVVAAVGSRYRGQNIHPATRSFQAIRIAVNGELEAVAVGVPAAVEMLKVGGRIAVISFHSLEDRIVKQAFRRLSGHCECPPRLPECRCGAKQILRVLTRKPVVPSSEEIEDNPRSRSAKLRCAERTSRLPLHSAGEGRGEGSK
jgi:16S rRNA (cytosine1402-N4)-methyltransferase